MAPPPPALPEELVEEILLRFPPDDPALLVRAALVCRRWCRLVSDPGFPRRFRELHRAPPLLGFLCNLTGAYGVDVARLVPTAAPFCSPRADRRGLRALDARHGRVLLHTDPKDPQEDHFFVWNPITEEQQKLPLPPVPVRRRPLKWWSWKAAVLCAARDGCDHLDCHLGPFLVIFVYVSIISWDTFAFVYSSKADAWSEFTVARSRLPYNRFELGASALVSNALYFRCLNDIESFYRRSIILRCDVTTGEMSMIYPPQEGSSQRHYVLMAMEDDRLGFAAVLNYRLHLWSREVGPNGDASWAQSRVVELDAIVFGDALSTEPRLAGFADGIKLVFIWTTAGYFIVDLKSDHIKKLGDGYGFGGIIPYTAFCTPALRAVFAEEGPGAVALGS
ncbi:hypothetical protein ACP70R_014619 [Stipagrostis hirtigluma subsp. patula]